jgi:hypothetical protein
MQTFLIDQKIGNSRSLTKEGFLLCSGVPIARTTHRDAPMLYAPGEVPVKAGPDGIIRVERLPEDVFTPETIASFAGKPVIGVMGGSTTAHGTGDVNPTNWKQLAVGVVQNPRRGEGLDDDLLLADLLITDADAIAAVRSGLREVSCGYDADYEELGPGRARQMNIIGNHVALVEHGRCGPRCSIGDHAMALTLKERIANAIASGDTATANALLGAAHVVDAAGNATRDESHIHVHVNGGSSATRDARGTKDDEETEEERKKREAKEAGDEEPAWFKTYREANDKKMKDFETALKGKKTGDDEISAEMVGGEGGRQEMERFDKVEENAGEGPPGGARDSAALVAAFADTLARAEILVPGVKPPTLDAKTDPKQTQDAICAFQKKVVQQAATGDHKELIAPLVAGVKFENMTCDAARILFTSASELVRRANNGRVAATAGSFRDRSTGPEVPTPRTLNEINRKRYGFDARR